MYKQGLESFLADLLPLAGWWLLKGPGGYVIAPTTFVQQHWYQSFQDHEVIYYRPPRHSSATRSATVPANRSAGSMGSAYAAAAAQPGSWVGHAYGTHLYYPPPPAAIPPAYSYSGVTPEQQYYAAVAGYPQVAAGYGYVQPYETSWYPGYNAAYAAAGYSAATAQAAPPLGAADAGTAAQETDAAPAAATAVAAASQPPAQPSSGVKAHTVPAQPAAVQQPTAVGVSPADTPAAQPQALGA